MKKSPLIRWRNLDGMGFKHSNMFEPNRNDTGLFYKQVDKIVFFVWHGEGGAFMLSEEEAKAFKAGKMGLVPPGCCNASGGESKEFDSLYDTYGLGREAFFAFMKEKTKK